MSNAKTLYANATIQAQNFLTYESALVSYAQSLGFQLTMFTDFKPSNANPGAFCSAQFTNLIWACQQYAANLLALIKQLSKYKITHVWQALNNLINAYPAPGGAINIGSSTAPTYFNANPAAALQAGQNVIEFYAILTELDNLADFLNIGLASPVTSSVFSASTNTQNSLIQSYNANNSLFQPVGAANSGSTQQPGPIFVWANSPEATDFYNANIGIGFWDMVAGIAQIPSAITVGKLSTTLPAINLAPTGVICGLGALYALGYGSFIAAIITALVKQLTNNETINLNTTNPNFWTSVLSTVEPQLPTGTSITVLLKTINTALVDNFAQSNNLPLLSAQSDTTLQQTVANAYETNATAFSTLVLALHAAGSLDIWRDTAQAIQLYGSVAAAATSEQKKAVIGYGLLSSGQQATFNSYLAALPSTDSIMSAAQPAQAYARLTMTAGSSNGQFCSLASDKQSCVMGTTTMYGIAQIYAQEMLAYSSNNVFNLETHIDNLIFGTSGVCSLPNQNNNPFNTLNCLTNQYYGLITTTENSLLSAYLSLIANTFAHSKNFSNLQSPNVTPVTPPDPNRRAFAELVTNAATSGIAGVTSGIGFNEYANNLQLVLAPSLAQAYAAYNNINAYNGTSGSSTGFWQYVFNTTSGCNTGTLTCIPYAAYNNINAYNGTSALSTGFWQWVFNTTSGSGCSTGTLICIPAAFALPNAYLNSTQLQTFTSNITNGGLLSGSNTVTSVFQRLMSTAGAQNKPFCSLTSNTIACLIGGAPTNTLGISTVYAQEMACGATASTIENLVDLRINSQRVNGKAGPCVLESQSNNPLNVLNCLANRYATISLLDTALSQQQATSSKSAAITSADPNRRWLAATFYDLLIAAGTTPTSGAGTTLALTSTVQSGVQSLVSTAYTAYASLGKQSSLWANMINDLFSSSSSCSSVTNFTQLTSCANTFYTTEIFAETQGEASLLTTFASLSKAQQQPFNTLAASGAFSINTSTTSGTITWAPATTGAQVFLRLMDTAGINDQPFCSAWGTDIQDRENCALAVANLYQEALTLFGTNIDQQVSTLMAPCINGQTMSSTNISAIEGCLNTALTNFSTLLATLQSIPLSNTITTTTTAIATCAVALYGILNPISTQALTAQNWSTILGQIIRKASAIYAPTTFWTQLTSALIANQPACKNTNTTAQSVVTALQCLLNALAPSH